MKIFFSIVITLFLFGCGGKEVTKEDLMKVKQGMTKAEVVTILGSPKESNRAGSFNGKPMHLLSYGEDTDVTLFDGKVETVTFKGEELLDPAE